MAQIRSLSRVVGLDRSASYTGSALAVSQLRLGDKLQPPSIAKESDLCRDFGRLGITPLEARLSACLPTKSNSGFRLSHYASTQEIRLPSLIKPINITVPTLYNGGLLEKELPPLLNQVDKIEPIIKPDVTEAPTNQVVEKQAVRLIIIRKKKMKKHKLKKLRKKMRFVRLKIRQAREYRKEKLFQATEMAKVREFDAFNATHYVADLIRRANETPIPNLYKGKKLPKPIIMELLEKDRLKKEKRKEQRKECAERYQKLQAIGYYPKE